jgi:pimeloyl-ACP methyl ester carboxylesterase
LVLLHGFAASGYSFREIGPLLGERYRVIAIDLNGFGFTERPSDFEAYSIAGQKKMVTAVLDELEIPKASVVGHSYGGQIALQLAKEQPDRVNGLVLISPPTSPESAPWFFRLGLVRNTFYPFLRLALDHPERFRKLFKRAYHQEELFTDDVAGEYRRRLLIEGLWDAYRGFGASMVKGGDEMPLPDFPVLVVAGRHDQVVPLETIKLYVEKLAQGRLHVLEESGHSSLEEEPEALRRVIEKFLQEHP